MLEVDVPEFHLRWTVDCRKRPDWNDPIFSSELSWPCGKYSLWYAYLKTKYCLGLQLESGVCPDPFDVSAQLDGTGRIATELSQKTRCSHHNRVRVYGTNKIYRWVIWARFASDIERSHPEFCLGRFLRFWVVIRDGHASPIALKSTTTQTEDIEELASSTSRTQTEFRIPESAGQSTRTASTSVQTTLLLNTPACLESLSEDFCQYMDQDTETDVEFQCGGVSIGAHGAVVCARSPVMASMLSSDMVEGRTRVVKIPNMEPDIFRHFLKYIYTGKLPELTEDTAMKLYEGGDQYAVLGLARRCSKYLLEHLSIHNACDVLLVAEAHSDGGLVERVVEYMVENKVPQVSDRWAAFCDEHPRLAIRVFNSLMKKGLK